MSKILTCLFSVCLVGTLIGQPINDECLFPISLGTVSDYCSGANEFTTTDATASPEPASNLCGTQDNDVWFSFRPTAPAALIQLFGSSLLNANINIYSGKCDNLVEIACKIAGAGITLAELSISDLTIGEKYILRVDGSNTGSFQICIKSFNPVPMPESDCVDAVVLCDKSPFVIDNLQSGGNDNNEIDINSCIQSEFASAWYTWTCKDAGTLTFTLSPTNPNDPEEDLDFAVYRLPNGLNDCASKELIRCMASGETQNQSAALNAPCFGPTGLSLNSTDFDEFPGCQPGDDNFVAALNMVVGESYALIVNNFSRSGHGFEIEFGGSGTFLGPEADFDIEAIQVLECDKEIIVTDLSNSFTDAIVSYSWNFGVGSMPPTANTVGPHNIEYESFGEKTIVLTIESSRGCLVTKFIDIFVDPCCENFPDLGITADPVDLTCFGIPTGQILPQGILGSPDYEYSLDGINWQSTPLFNGLPAGSYEIFIRDIKGCINSTTVVINQPAPQVLEIGPDTTVTLGETVSLDAFYTPPQPGDSLIWCVNGVPVTDLNLLGFEEGCTNCLDPTILPLGTNTYELKVLNEAGCEIRDQLVITTDIIRPLYFPNIIVPEFNATNGLFTIGVGPQVQSLDLLEVYDRWGNLVYTEDGDGQGLVLFENEGDVIIDPSRPIEHHGWNGRYGIDRATPGVYAWLAVITFIDGEEISYAGHVTLAR